MTELNESENKILNKPENYAAIYARISSKKDNNSIEAQISKAKVTLNNRNLLLYAVYTDHVSGRTVSPSDRAGFGKLLADARAKCFKTIIVYKHDRIVRNLEDWINLKSELRKLKVKIIFSDESEYTPDDSLQGEFIENLLVMVAELEPNNINERVTFGKEQRRKEGVYNSANHISFAYERKSNNSEKSSNGKSHYEIKPLEAIFVQFIFCEAKKALSKDVIKVDKIKEKKDLIINNFLELNSFPLLINEILSFAERISKLLEKTPERFLKNILIALQVYLNDKQIDVIKEELNIIKVHLDSTGNIQTILANPVYAAKMLLYSNEEQQGIIIDGNIPRLNEIKFVELKNVAPIIDKKTLSKVYSYMLMPEVLKVKEPNYMFKGKFKCSNCNVYLHYEDGLLQCTNVGKKKGCKAYSKSNLIESVLDIIIDDAFNKMDSVVFTRFYCSLNSKIQPAKEEIENLKKSKMIQLKEYLIDRNIGHINEVNEKQERINWLLKKIANYEYELDKLNNLQNYCLNAKFQE